MVSEHSSAPLKEQRQLPKSCSARDKDRLLPLVIETLYEGDSVLVFCGSRLQTQCTAGMIAEALPRVLVAKFTEQRRSLVEELRREVGESMDSTLEKALLAGEQQFRLFNKLCAFLKGRRHHFRAGRYCRPDLGAPATPPKSSSAWNFVTALLCCHCKLLFCSRHCQGQGCMCASFCSTPAQHAAVVTHVVSCCSARVKCDVH